MRVWCKKSEKNSDTAYVDDDSTSFRDAGYDYTRAHYRYIMIMCYLACRYQMIHDNGRKKWSSNYVNPMHRHHYRAVLLLLFSILRVICVLSFFRTKNVVTRLDFYSWSRHSEWESGKNYFFFAQFLLGVFFGPWKYLKNRLFLLIKRSAAKMIWTIRKQIHFCRILSIMCKFIFFHAFNVKNA